MEILKAILLGFLQGVTEFLPISSSGHLSVFQHFFGKLAAVHGAVTYGHSDSRVRRLLQDHMGSHR